MFVPWQELNKNSKHEAITLISSKIYLVISETASLNNKRTVEYEFEREKMH